MTDSTYNHFILPGLGPGWDAAVLNSAVELDIIVQNIVTNGSAVDYYIGGSAPSGLSNLNFSSYLPDSSGMKTHMFTMHVLPCDSLAR